ncbi:MAG: VOC family protein [Bacteroidales bacterium]
MILEHVAIWTENLEEMKSFYVTHLGGKAGAKYCNTRSGFESYFITFDSGARLELMKRNNVPDNLNDRAGLQHKGLIHIAFGVSSHEEVDKIARDFAEAGIPVLNGPRITGDGYYEIEALDPERNRIEITTAAI